LINKEVFFDTNILLYAYGERGGKSHRAEVLLAGRGIVSVQILNEFANVMRSKFKLHISRVRDLVEEVIIDCPQPRAITLETHRLALRLCERYGFSVYDSTIVASALEANCTILYTEDLHHGQQIDGLRIENPFLQSGQEG
jgi:predicted nucleic acid-binding protein